MSAGEIKHTATPWHVTDSIHNGKVFISKEGSERGSVALCEREEDAAFIVRAVNAHDDLVQALQWSFDFPPDFFEDREDTEIVTITIEGRHLKMVRDALAKAQSGISSKS